MRRSGESKEAIEKLEKDKLISEDDKFRSIDELQKIVDKYIAMLTRSPRQKKKRSWGFRKVLLNGYFRFGPLAHLVEHHPFKWLCRVRAAEAH